MGDLSLICQEAVCVHLSNDFIFRRSFPNSLSSRFGYANHKTARDIMLPGYFFILLHQRNIKLGVLIDLDSELRVVEPSVVTFELNMFS